MKRLALACLVAVGLGFVVWVLVGDRSGEDSATRGRAESDEPEERLSPTRSVVERVPAEEKAPAATEVDPRGGRIVRLRLLDEGGRVIAPDLDELEVRYSRDARSWVPLRLDDSGRSLGTHRTPMRLQAADGGAFLLTDHLDVEIDGLSVTVDGVGTGRLDLRGLDPQGDAIVERDVVLEATGRVLGLVVDGTGAPIRDLDVAVSWSIDARPEPFVLEDWEAPGPRRRLEIGGPAGQLVATAKTDPSGHFSFDGLARRPMQVFARRVTRETYENRWDVLFAVTPEVDIERRRVQLARARIECTLTGPVGEKVRLEIHDAGPSAGPPRVELGWYGSRAPLQQPIRTHSESLGEGPSVARFELPHGRHYAVTLSADERCGPTRTVTLADDDQVARIQLDHSELRSLGSLHVSLVVAADPESREGGYVAVWLEDPDSGYPYDEVTYGRQWHARGEPAHLRAPIGPVRVVAEGIVPVEPWHGTVAGQRVVGRAEAIVDVAPGKVNEVELVVEPAAKLEVDVRGEVSAADISYEKDRLHGDGARSLFEEEGEALGVRITLTDTTTDVTFPLIRIDHAMMNSSAAGRHILQFWPLGETHTSAGMPAGTFELRATQATRAPIVKTVTLIPGETARAVVDFGG